MLKIHLKGFPDNCIKNIDGYFNMEKDRDWFNRPDVKRIIKNIDNTIAVKDEYLESPVFGGMAPDRLSKGCKGVVMLAVLDDINLYATGWGDNCAPEILEVAKYKDIEITLHRLMRFPEPFEIYLVDYDKTITTMGEFYFAFYYDGADEKDL